MSKTKANPLETAPAVVTNQLPPDVAKQFELVNWTGGHRQAFGRFGIVDLTTLTVAQAERLVKKGFKKLKAK